MPCKVPKVGDEVIHRLPHIDEERTGKVCWLLTSAFAYEDDNGANWLCGFKEDWDYVNR